MHVCYRGRDGASANPGVCANRFFLFFERRYDMIFKIKTAKNMSSSQLPVVGLWGICFSTFPLTVFM